VKLKLDENLGTRVQRVFADADLSVSSVRVQGLSGKADEVVFATCS
jgi:predicted nuclease of predicted toxin-antitoxin system